MSSTILMKLFYCISVYRVKQCAKTILVIYPKSKLYIIAISPCLWCDSVLKSRSQRWQQRPPLSTDCRLEHWHRHWLLHSRCLRVGILDEIWVCTIQQTVREHIQQAQSTVPTVKAVMAYHSRECNRTTLKILLSFLDFLLSQEWKLKWLAGQSKELMKWLNRELENPALCRVLNHQFCLNNWPVHCWVWVHWYPTMTQHPLSWTLQGLNRWWRDGLECSEL